jgi:hypothetical protein
VAGKHCSPGERLLGWLVVVPTLVAGRLRLLQLFQQQV